MTKDGQARLDRLVMWIKQHRLDLLSDGEVSAAKMSEAFGNNVPYWYGMLSKQKDRSFGTTVARKMEEALRMPPFYLEGSPVADWPFELVTAEEFYALSPKQQGAIEKVMADAIASLRQKQTAEA